MISFALSKTLHGANEELALHVAGQIAPATTLALFGPSGSGKTSVLRMLAGLMPPDSGQISISGAVWFDHVHRHSLATEHRAIGMQFQQPALFPHLPALAQLEFAGASKADAQALLTMVELEGYATRKPAALSGGQQQRLALARALARKPTLLLLDEPLAAQDAALRLRLQARLRDYQQQHACTIVLASHDVAEIVQLADEVWQLEAGQIIARGTPATVLLGGNPTGSVLAIADGIALISVGGGVLHVRLSAEETNTLVIGSRLELSATRLAALQYSQHAADA